MLIRKRITFFSVYLSFILVVRTIVILWKSFLRIFGLYYWFPSSIFYLIRAEFVVVEFVERFSTERFGFGFS